MLSDLFLADLPIEALISLKQAVNAELLSRKKNRYVSRRLSYNESSQFSHTIHNSTYEEALQLLIESNASQLLSLPSQALRNHFRDRLRYLPCILHQDWSHLFQGTFSPRELYYVYAHIDPRKAPTELTALQVKLQGAPFYIGKGTARRAWQLTRNQGHKKIIKHIRDAGFPDDSMVQIISDRLCEQEALILEAKLIYLLGSIYDETIHGCLLNLADHIKPNFFQGMHKLPPRRIFYDRQIKEQNIDSPHIPLKER